MKSGSSRQLRERLLVASLCFTAVVGAAGALRKPKGTPKQLVEHARLVNTFVNAKLKGSDVAPVKVYAGGGGILGYNLVLEVCCPISTSRARDVARFFHSACASAAAERGFRRLIVTDRRFAWDIDMATGSVGNRVALSP